METIPPSMPPPGHLGASPGNDEASDLYNFLGTISQQGWGSISQFSTDILNGLPSSYTAQDIQNKITSLMNGSWPEGNGNYDFFMHYNISDHDTALEFNTLSSGINYICSGVGDAWTMPTPNVSFGDQMLQELPGLNYQSGVESLLKPILGFVDSFTLPSQIKSWLDSQFTDPNFAANHPNFSAASTWSDLQDLAGKVGSQLPSYAQSFIECVGGVQQAAPGSDDAKFFQAIIENVQGDWPNPPSEKTLIFFFAMINTTFNQYPDLSPAAESVFEVFAANVSLGGSIPTFEKQFIEVRHWINTSSPPLSGSALTLANALMQKTLTNWPNPADPGTLSNWFNSLGNGNEDIYMFYPDLSLTNAAMLAQICGASVPQKTPMDTLFFTLLTNQLPFSVDSNDYRLFNDAINQCKTAGSTGSVDKVVGWMQNQINYQSLNSFPAYLPLQSSTAAQFIGSFGFKYLGQYYSAYLLETYPVITTSPDAPVLAAKLRQIIAGYVLTHPNGSAAGLQSYLNTSMANNNLALATGASPFLINDLFVRLGFQMPYSYANPDWAYAAVIWGCNLVSNPKLEPDYDILDKLVTDINNSINHPDQYPYQNVLDSVKGLEGSPQWSQLQSSTQTVLKGILLMGPVPSSDQ